MATVIGLDRLQAKLRTLTSEVAKAAVPAGQAAALPIQDAWKRKAPVKTGSYRRSIHTEVLEVSDERVVVGIGTDIIDPPYPKFLEFGTARMAPRPSARPAFDENRARAVEEARAVFQKVVNGVTR